MRLYPRSLRVQLCAWYVALTMICMSALGVFSYLYLRHALASSREQTMQKRENRLLRYVREEPHVKVATPLSESLRRFGLASPDSDLLQVYTPAGVKIYPELNVGLRVAWPASPCQIPCFQVTTLGGHNLRVLQHDVVINGQEVMLTMAGVIDEHYDILRTVRNSYMIFLPLMLTASIVGGLVLGHRALVPVDRMTLAAHSISIHDLTRRLPVPQTGDEIQRLAETWNQVLARLESAVAHLTQFTSDISHDLRTTITVMLSTAQLSLRRERSSEDYQEALKTVVHECESTTSFLDDLLALARIDASQQNVELAAISLSSIIWEVAEHLRPRAWLKSQTLEAQLASDAWILGDPALVRRLSVILIENAIKYTPEHGRIKVSVLRSEEGLKLEVSDNGMGIAAEDLPKIFDRFYRSDASRNRDEGGSGLGLAIAKWIAHTHTASIEVRSGEWSGSTFSVSFPVLETGLDERSVGTSKLKTLFHL
ncbi:MAG: integral rane sensor signal transduction histidine kinase [Acidobacteriaceae bacterium]|nr:integral rane sensor signal transduction histidine kinase [Acidobacteriaceae bacterium]